MTEDSPAADHVYLWLLDAIGGDRLRVGEWYSVRWLSQETAVSRTPAREALLRIARLGLVDIKRNRGFVLRRLTVEHVRSTYETRMLFEIPAVGAAARASHRALADVLYRHLFRMDEFLAQANTAAYRESDRALHAEILGAAGNARVKSLAQTLADSSAQTWSLPSTGAAHFRADSWQQHYDIVEAIAAKKPARAERAMREHLEGAAAGFMRYVASMNGEPLPERFSGRLSSASMR